MYINPEDGSPAFVVRFFNTEEEQANLKQYIIDQFKKRDASITEAIHKGDDTPRKSSVIWYNDKKMSDILFNCMRIANHEAGWQYDITGHETMQITRYQEGDRYEWHVDGDGNAWEARRFDFKKEGNLLKTPSPGLVGTIRKLSATIIVNDDYEGGQFETMHLHRGEVVKSQVKAAPGCAIIFPSNIHHRVTPVTKGTRYSMVVWYAGPPFK